METTVPAAHLFIPHSSGSNFFFLTFDDITVLIFVFLYAIKIKYDFRPCKHTNPENRFLNAWRPGLTEMKIRTSGEWRLINMQFLYLIFHSQQFKLCFLFWFNHCKTLCSVLVDYTVSDIQCPAGKKPKQSAENQKHTKSGYRQHSRTHCCLQQLQDPGCQPEVLSWKCSRATSVQEVAGVRVKGVQGWTADDTQISTPQASGKLGATGKYTHTAAQSDKCKCILTHVDSALSGQYR